MVDATVRSFQEFKDIRSELNLTKLKQDELTAVERAKGLLMSQRGMDEETAYEMLCAMAAKKNMKLVDLANQFVDVAKMLIV